MNTPPQPPITFDATEESLLLAAKEQIAATKAVWDEITAATTRETATWDNTILPIIQDENRKLCASRYLGFYKSTSPDPELRNASTAASALFDDAEVELHVRSDMFALVDAVEIQLATTRSSQDAESRFYLQKLHRRFTQSGCGLREADAKVRFMHCQRRIKELERQCNKNHHDESTMVCFAPEELVGVPDSFLSQLKTDEAGFWISTKVAQSSRILRHATQDGTRKKMFYAIQNKMPANIALFRELILLRDEAARLVDYPNHAALRISDKMMRSPAAVSSMLDELEARLVPEGANDVAQLLDIKRKTAAARGDSECDLERVFFWDVPYLAHLQEDQGRSVAIDISDYYELHHTLAKLLDIFKKLFGVGFTRVTADEQKLLGKGKPLVWHDDVLMYTVWDKREDVTAGVFMGYAYLDLHPRPGKYTHNGHYFLQPNFDQHDGSHNKASSVLVMNYMQTPGRPTLLGLEGVRKLFHEIGHLVHALCTETKYASSQQVDRDFVEAPALMFEYFFWQPQLIQDVACHWAWLSPEHERTWRETVGDNIENASASIPPKKLPEDVVASIAKSDVKRMALRDELNSLFFAKYDLMIHSPESHEALVNMNLTAEYNKMKSGIRSLAGGEALGEGLEWGHGETVFRAVINKYDAGYYAYVLGSILASDIFHSGFEMDPMSPSSGARYRDMVLKVGGSKPELDTITSYLGRPFTNQALIESLGI